MCQQTLSRFCRQKINDIIEILSSQTLLINQPTNQSTNQPINQSTNQSTNQFIRLAQLDGV
jgi:hypothetical protein